MILGDDLITKGEIKEGSVACFKAYQIDPDNSTVEKLSMYCVDPKSAEEIEKNVLSLLKKYEK